MASICCCTCVAHGREQATRAPVGTQDEGLTVAGEVGRDELRRLLMLPTRSWGGMCSKRV
eukprot:CAMPEP_0185157666 /NCGR_PEP_ID=MMETSP1139-20130426/1919_1 /TAXON_ID=298111 /ORGANISM="Pavlova sp., Strain CCMP459" /LENGTH=59 /DNA_ID=CAMNT_0027722761 /DNA_START=13 /DNA_END=192 /DNA_ORIENTATION=-